MADGRSSLDAHTRPSSFVVGRILRKTAWVCKMSTPAVAALVIIGSASAASPIYWTPTHMAKALTALRYPHAGTIGGTCHGATKARHGTYTGFRCLMIWQAEGTDGKVTVWARPLAHGRVCGSTRSLASCRLLAAGPLAGDPTACGYSAEQCAKAAAEAAVVAKHGQGTANLICSEQQDLYHWSCTSMSGPFTVTFTKGVSAWTVTVTP